MFEKYKISEEQRANWEYLITHFTPEYIERMQDINEYAIGLGKDNRSFSYLVEIGTKEVANMPIRDSATHGLYWSKKNEQFETRKRYKDDVKRAFSETKVALAKLIREAKELNVYRELESDLFLPIKRKIVFLYNPEIMIPIVVEDEIHFFEECLRLPKTHSFEEGQIELVKYRKENSSSFPTNWDLMDYLYKTYKRKGGKTKPLPKDIIVGNDVLDDACVREANDIEDGKPVEYVAKPEDKVQPDETRGGRKYYKRDGKRAWNALERAERRCECNPQHECFIRRKDGKRYTEPHHLIPMAFYDEFDHSIDVEANIVSLCSNCHNEIHYGQGAKELITKLYNDRKEQLKEAGIEISLGKLLEYYSKI